MDALSDLETALGAELLRAELLGQTRPRLGDRYAIESFLGRGATGLVVAAHDDRLGRPVALKLSIGGAETSGLAEARALARLDHPNVVRVFDVAIVQQVFDGRPFRLWVLAMQKVPGRSLRVWLKEKPRSVDDVVAVFRSAGAGLAAAHGEKIVHRDFKPDNVLVRDDGVAQVIDFGFAVAARSNVEDAESNAVAGTAPYLSPEARRGIATTKSDQYAFAISMVEALTGEAKRPTDDAIPAGTSLELWVALTRATEPDPARRFKTMTDLLTALGRHRSTGMTWGWMLVLVLVAVWHFRVELGLTTARSTVSRTSPVATGIVSCSELNGQWRFETRVTESAYAGLEPGTRGEYNLVLADTGGCNLRGVLTRTNDAQPGALFRPRADPVTAVIRAHGSVGRTWVTAERVEAPLGGCVHTFSWIFSERSLSGTFAANCGARSYSGIIENGER